MRCTACRFHIYARNTCVGGIGPTDNVDILFVGECPDADEDRTGRGWSGPVASYAKAAVRWLSPTVRKAIGRGPRVRWTYALRCFPDEDDKWRGVKSCRHHLIKEIKAVKPKRIITFGAIAASSLVQERIRILNVIEGWHTMDFGYGKVPIQFLVHPKAALNNKAFQPTWKRQFKRVFLHKPPKHLLGTDEVVTHIVDDPDEAVDVIESMMLCETCAYDVEYNSRTGRLLCYALAVDENEAYAFPEHILKIDRVNSTLQRLFTYGVPVMHAHNWKFDAKQSVTALGMPVDTFTDVERAWVDTSTLRKIENAEQESKLEVSEWMVGLGGHKKPLYDLLGTMNTDVPTIGDRYEKAYDTNPELILNYCGGDVMACLRLGNLYRKRLSDAELLPAWDDTLGPVGPVLFEMERGGMGIDKDATEALDTRLSSEIAIVREAILADPTVARVEKRTKSKSMLKDGFNPDSTDHMAELMFKPYGLRFKPLSYTPTGKPQITAAVRKNFAEKAPVLQECTEYVRLVKLRSTYVKGWQSRLESDGRLHTTFRQDVARTGRLASRDPNL